MEQIRTFLDSNLASLQFIDIMDVIEILLISLMVYYVIAFTKETRAWFLLKGVFWILVFLAVAMLLEMNTILWIARSVFQLAAIALIVVLQPELRKALEGLGKKDILHSVLPFDTGKPEEGLFSDKTVREISKGCMEMARVKTGALIVVEQKDSLEEYERTGIAVDGIVTSQLLINIFEKNTPLHDGAVIVRNSMTVIVSEETGSISVAYKGKLTRGLNAPELEEMLRSIQNKAPEEKERKRWKGWPRNEK